MKTLQTWSGGGGGYNENNPSIPNTTTPNGIVNVDTSASANATAEGYGQTPGARKHFAYYNHSLIAEKSLFWIYHRGKVSGEVASVFENTDMYGKVLNFPFPSSSIHNVFLKWDMTKVTGVINLQHYPTTVNIRP